MSPPAGAAPKGYACGGACSMRMRWLPSWLAMRPARSQSNQASCYMANQNSFWSSMQPACAQLAT